MATIRLVPSSYYLSNSSYLRVASESNMYDNTDSTTHGTFTHNRQSTSNTYYAYLRGFNFDDVPSNADVSGFTIKIKASATGHTSSTSSSYYMSLANGTTQIGSTYADGRLTTSTDIFTFSEGSLDWDTLVNYGSNFGIRIPLRRASSSTADVVSVYGAEIEVTYTLPNPRTITTALSGNGTISPSGANTFYDGDEVEITITPTNKADTVTATKDGADITSQLVAHGSESTTTFSADSVDTNGVQNGTSYASYAVGHTAEDPSTSGESSNMYASSGSTGYAEYSFDFSSIPSGATIESVEARVYGHRESATIDSTHVSSVAIYNNGSAISDEVDFPSTGNSTITVTPNTTPSSMSNVTLRHFVGYYGGLVLGISFEVTYSTGSGLDHYTYTFTVSADTTIAVAIGGVASPKLFLKVNGTWKPVSVYVKQNSSWIAVSDPTTVLTASKKYVKKES